MAKAHFTQADIKRALKVAHDVGLNVAGYRIEPDGSIQVMTAEAAESAADRALAVWEKSNAPR
ncbi:hypothetical protein [Oceanicella sp. SM1341]|uniref:hypothetical protein n=1 Tax=Oceanicella sp. SM1341 TaxID=1548889 RepID=UPI000E47A313|nr:hypothetical protein [Oceanicella sp. SM1341]